MKISINGVVEEFRKIGLRRTVAEIKKLAGGRGLVWKASEIIIFSSPMPGWVRVKQAGYEQFITVREDDWVVDPPAPEF